MERTTSIVDNENVQNASKHLHTFQNHSDQTNDIHIMFVKLDYPQNHELGKKGETIIFLSQQKN